MKKILEQLKKEILNTRKAYDTFKEKSGMEITETTSINMRKDLKQKREKAEAAYVKEFLKQLSNENNQIQ